jgi:hypothetical protein
MDLQPHRYVINRNDGTQGVALEPWRVRPSIQLGIRVALFEPKAKVTHER